MNIDASYKYKTDLIDGTLVKVAEDQQRNEWCYMMTKQTMLGIGEEPNYLIRLFAIHYDEVYEISEGIQEPIDSKKNSLINFSFRFHKLCSCILP